MYQMCFTFGSAVDAALTGFLIEAVAVATEEKVEAPNRSAVAATIEIAMRVLLLAACVIERIEVFKEVMAEPNS